MSRTKKFNYVNTIRISATSNNVSKNLETTKKITLKLIVTSIVIIVKV